MAAQFLLCSLYGNRFDPHDERALMSLFARLVRCDPDGNEVDAAAPDKLLKGGLFSHMVIGYLRALPDGAAWLQATLGKVLAKIVHESESEGLRLLTDPMEAYLSLPADAKEEVDRDVARGEAASLDMHVRVVEILSMRSTALCERCEVVLDAVASVAQTAPRGVRALARVLTGSVTSEHGGGGGSSSGGGASVGADADARRHVRALLVSLLFNSYILPAVATPEAYGLHLSGRIVGAAARQNLSAVAMSLEQLVGLVALGVDEDGGSPPAGSAALMAARRYFTPRLISTAPMSAVTSALALCALPPPTFAEEEWPTPLADGGGQAPTEDVVTAPSTVAKHDEEEARTWPGSTGVVVLEETCLVALLRFVHEQLGDEVALPTSLISLISNGSLGGHGVGSSPLQRDGNASVGGVDGTSHPPVLAHQARCWFTKGGGRRLAVVLNVHYDDEVPYYTILMDGAERSTVRKYLLPLTFAEECMAGAGRAAEGRHIVEVQIIKVGPLGITLENAGDLLSPPQVTNITTGGAAHRSGLLRVGDLLAAINGTKIFDHAEGRRIITATDGQLNLVVLRTGDHGKGLGTIGPVKAFYGASSSTDMGSAGAGGDAGVLAPIPATGIRCACGHSCSASQPPPWTAEAREEEQGRRIRWGLTWKTVWTTASRRRRCRSCPRPRRLRHHRIPLPSDGHRACSFRLIPAQA